MKRTHLVIAALLAVAAPLRAQVFTPSPPGTWIDYWVQCTTGALRACASTQVAFSYGLFPMFPVPTTTIFFRLSNLQGLPGFESGPRGLRGVTVHGLEETTGTPILDVDFGQHYSVEGAATTHSVIDFPGAFVNERGTLSSFMFLDFNSYLFGCALRPGPFSDFELLYDQTCVGSITYAVSLTGELRPASGQLPSLEYSWAAWESDSPLPTGFPTCTTGIDCAMVTPEPVTTVLMATGLLGIAGVAALRKRRRERTLVS